ncbi:unnamed protein product [Owenia fusiformis]|uniref:small monomeric GTPase n=1 Tax=Owenia fusiformis TaxID=6347 RepID=A0A8J1XXL2_OWEFU|nr:unnamed protein product [Owenia fusiformis]
MYLRLETGGIDANMSSPKMIQRLSNVSKKPFKVVVLGQSGVGKSAFTVRLLTRRFIGEYDPTLEQKYVVRLELNKDDVEVEVLDTAGQEEESLHLDGNLKWADGFILIYDVTDRCSFDECTRLKFLINRAKKGRKSSSSVVSLLADIPVALVGNKNDKINERLVSEAQGEERAKDLNCPIFLDTSVRESVDSAHDIVEQLYREFHTRRSPRPPQRRNKSVEIMEDPNTDDTTGDKQSLPMRIMNKVIPVGLRRSSSVIRPGALPQRSSDTIQTDTDTDDGFTIPMYRERRKAVPYMDYQHPL